MNLGIAGTGYIAGTVLPVLKKLGISVNALCSTPRSRQKMESMCKEYGIPRGFISYEEMLEAGGETEPLTDTVYIAAPNSLHCELAKKALLAGKHVIVEKPFASNLREAREMAELARERKLLVMEAISTLYIPDYLKAKELLQRLGSVRIISCNFSQYSSRYDAFLKGDVKPVFDPAQSGGALMDLNVYNIHYAVGLFGMPESVYYQPNYENGVDTSGILTLGYDGFSAVLVAAKDSKSPCFGQIQGTKGYLRHDSALNACENLFLVMNDGEESYFHEETIHRMAPEFLHFRDLVDGGNPEAAEEMLEHSLKVMEVLDRARGSAGIKFPADEN